VSIAAVGMIFDVPEWAKLTVGTLIALAAVVAMGNRALFAGLLVMTMLTINGWETLARSWREGQMTRSYFGIYSIRPLDTRAVSLVHGTTLHGVQLTGKGRELMPTTYYAPESGVGLAVSAAPALFGAKARIGIVGLGAGTLACYAQSGQSWKFYEIDPVVERIARDPKNFTFMSKCAQDVPVAIGDARIVIANEPAASHDLLAIDAFSSDSVPMHLLTAEAFETYRRNLAPGGLLMVHISNRYLNLQPVLAAAARNGWTTALRHYRPDKKGQDLFYSASIWVAMSPDPKTIEQLKQETGREKWTTLGDDPNFKPWTDSYGSILPLLYARW
jgi:spermidine synthase